jgi:hypothetical protein
MPRQRHYVCTVCDWQGMLEPSEPLLDAPCPECGTLLAPEPWWRNLGLAAVLVVGSMALVAVGVYLWAR